MNILIVKSCSNGEAPNDYCPFYSESSVSCNLLGRRVSGEFSSETKPEDCPLLEGKVTVELEDYVCDDDEDDEDEELYLAYEDGEPDEVDPYHDDDED